MRQPSIPALPPGDRAGGAPPPLRRAGYHVEPAWLPPGRCAELLREIEAARRVVEPPLVERPALGRPLRYRVFDGEAVRR
ncbi:MAG TPA: hypothetical protein VNM66_06885, partial [Thermodesulfobacteriota bacterium]|nr:hypothetical protein [Thermodesulfobacteriota bacterium]